MRLFHVPWISHDGGAIFSVDIHKSGKKLATAGQGPSGAGLLIIWPIEFLFEEDVTTCDAEYYAHLARISCPTKSINCVRWCRRQPSRFVFAGDDGMVCVYEFVGSILSRGTLQSGSAGKAHKSKSLDNYKRQHTLNGHTADVLHVDWSPDGRFLASASLDGCVIVWNAEQLPNRVTTLNRENGGHTCGVKGLSWDPMGRFLATQAEDNSLKLWQTDSWECVRVFDEPFQEAAGSTLFLRMDWSPDGSYLVAPCAMNNGAPTANIISRRDWNHHRDFVGFRKAVSCVRANPRCFSRELGETGQRTIVSCFATGSRDRSLGVWLVPSVGRPIVLFDKFFKLSVVDLSWNDLNLAACSSDGVVRILNFNESEIGEALSHGEMMSLSEKIYGFLPDVYKNDDVISMTTHLSLLNDNLIYSAWRDAFLERFNFATKPHHQYANFSTSNLGGKNIFQMKRKFSADYLEQMLVKAKRQRRLELSALQNDQKSLTASSEDNTQKEFTIETATNTVGCELFERKDRPLLERFVSIESSSHSSDVFTISESRSQIHVKTTNWRFKSTIQCIEVLNNYSIGYGCSTAVLYCKQVRRRNSHSYDVVARISAFGQNHKKIWSVYAPDFVSNVSSNSHFTCVVSFDGRFSCYSTRTGRLIFSIVLDCSSICEMILNGDTCILISQDGRLVKCDLKRRKCHGKLLSSLLENKEQQLFVRATSERTALLTSDGGNFLINDNEDHDNWSSCWDAPNVAPSHALLRDNFYPLLQFPMFFMTKDEWNIILRGSSLASESEKVSCNDLNIDEVCEMLCINNKKMNEDGVCFATYGGGDTVFLDEALPDSFETFVPSLGVLLESAIERGAESEARFIVALIALRLIRQDKANALKNFARLLKSYGQFGANLYKHFSRLLTEFSERIAIL